MQQANLGMIGGGTVGSGVFHALQLNGALMASRVGVKVHVRKIAVKAFDEPRPYEIPESLMTTDWQAVVNDPQVDIVTAAEKIRLTVMHNNLNRIKAGQTSHHRKQSFAFGSWRGVIRCRATARNQSLLRSECVRRHPHH